MGNAFRKALSRVHTVHQDRNKVVWKEVTLRKGGQATWNQGQKILGVFDNDVGVNA